MGKLADRVEVEKAEPRPPSPKQVLTKLLERNKGAIGVSLPRGMDQDRFVRLLLTATATNPKLLECDPLSFLRAGVISAQLGLEPNDPRGEAYLIPYGKQVQFQPGYRGLMKLARRAGAAGFAGEAVYEGDDFDWEQGSESWLQHKARGEDDPAKLTHAWALAKVDGEPEFVVMFRTQIDKVMRESEAFKRAERGKKDSPWHQFYAEMAVKTAIKRLCKKLPQEAELHRALNLDDQAERGLVIEGVDLGGADDVIEATEATDKELAPAPPGVDVETGEVIETTSSEPTPEEAAEIDRQLANDPGRPF